ncbi:hypothetical protein GCM10010439_41550 [Actinocorallia aurantiaca]|uniref:Uncharacterized protein n=1 Tax=Actinocorallia aurantiaca TaxID=46204 RepID=A0ABN3UDB3_9ACTN
MGGSGSVSVEPSVLVRSLWMSCVPPLKLPRNRELTVVQVEIGPAESLRLPFTKPDGQDQRPQGVERIIRLSADVQPIPEGIRSVLGQAGKGFITGGAGVRRVD